MKLLKKSVLLVSIIGMSTFVMAQTMIEHQALDYVEPEKRFGLSAKITDESGVNKARAYFKSKDSADFVFVDMTCKEVDKSSSCIGVLPSPTKETKEIEYVFLVENGNKEVSKSQTFSAPVMSEKDVPTWKKAKQALDTASDVKDAIKVAEKVLKINSEAANISQTVSGFGDKVLVQAVELKEKLGVVSGLTSSSSSGTTATSVSSASGTSSAGTVAASSGVATSTVVAVAGGVVAAGAVSSANESDSSSSCVTMEGDWTHKVNISNVADSYYLYNSNGSNSDCTSDITIGTYTYSYNGTNYQDPTHSYYSISSCQVTSLTKQYEDEDELPNKCVSKDEFIASVSTTENVSNLTIENFSSNLIKWSRSNSGKVYILER